MTSVDRSLALVGELEARVSNALRVRLLSERDPGERLHIIKEWLCPPEPQLLDTSVLQNLDWVDRKLEAAENGVDWHDAAVSELQARFGTELAADLIDLGTLYKQFEHYGSYPWLVCNAAVDEANVLQSEKGDRLRQLLSFLSGHQEDWHDDSFPGIAKGLLLARGAIRVSPLILHALGVSTAEELSEDAGPLSFLHDRGDRSIVAHAVLANIPAILTTDRRTFWVHREKIRGLGVEVLRPTELLDLYIPYWDAMEYEFARRRTESRR